MHQVIIWLSTEGESIRDCLGRYNPSEILFMLIMTLKWVKGMDSCNYGENNK